MARSVTSTKGKESHSWGRAERPGPPRTLGWTFMWGEGCSSREKGQLPLGLELECHPPHQPTGSRRNGRLRLPTNQDENPGRSYSHSPLAVSWAQFPQNSSFSWGPYCFNFMLHQNKEDCWVTISEPEPGVHSCTCTGSDRQPPEKWVSFLSDLQGSLG